MTLFTKNVIVENMNFRGSVVQMSIFWTENHNLASNLKFEMVIPRMANTRIVSKLFFLDFYVLQSKEKIIKSSTKFTADF